MGRWRLGPVRSKKWLDQWIIAHRLDFLQFGFYCPFLIHQPHRLHTFTMLSVKQQRIFMPRIMQSDSFKVSDSSLTVTSAHCTAVAVGGHNNFGLVIRIKSYLFRRSRQSPCTKPDTTRPPADYCRLVGHSLWVRNWTVDPLRLPDSEPSLRFTCRMHSLPVTMTSRDYPRTAPSH